MSKQSFLEIEIQFMGEIFEKTSLIPANFIENPFTISEIQEIPLTAQAKDYRKLKTNRYPFVAKKDYAETTPYFLTLDFASRSGKQNVPEEIQSYLNKIKNLKHLVISLKLPSSEFNSITSPIRYAIIDNVINSLQTLSPFFKTLSLDCFSFNVNFIKIKNMPNVKEILDSMAWPEALFAIKATKLSVNSPAMIEKFLEHYATHKNFSILALPVKEHQIMQAKIASFLEKFSEFGKNNIEVIKPDIKLVQAQFDRLLKDLKRQRDTGRHFEEDKVSNKKQCHDDEMEAVRVEIEAVMLSHLS